MEMFVPSLEETWYRILIYVCALGCRFSSKSQRAMSFHMTKFTADSDQDTPGIALSHCETSRDSLTGAGP